jgi:Fe2+ or Zn2+ uptake regulation protein
MYEKYVKLLKENQIKITPQRLEILRYLDSHRTHPTVDEIFSELKSENPALSKTTVYNSVDVLKERGLIQSISISGSEQRYDFKQSMHHHFLCNKCGRITDIDIECPNLRKILDRGDKVEEVHGYFKGVCKKCLGRKDISNE